MSLTSRLSLGACLLVIFTVLLRARWGGDLLYVARSDVLHLVGNRHVLGL